MESNFEIKGYTGQLTVTQDKIIIQRKGLGGFISRGILAGVKEIPIKNITAIQFRNANWLTNGMIQFSIHGEMGHKGSSIDAVNDENTILFTNKQQEDFLKAKELIEDIMKKVEIQQNRSHTTISNAEELKKFAELKDAGIITEEEFLKKKNEILNM